MGEFIFHANDIYLYIVYSTIQVCVFLNDSYLVVIIVSAIRVALH